VSNRARREKNPPAGVAVLAICYDAINRSLQGAKRDVRGCDMRGWLFIVAVLVAGTVAQAEEISPRLGPSKADEPLAKTFSVAKGAEFLDGVALGWTKERKCANCHTNVPYLMMRPALKMKPSAEERTVRKFFEDSVAGWEDGEKPRGDAYVVNTAVALAFHDAGTGKLHPLTRKALDRMWTIQMKNGAWNWIKCSWPPLEHDDYFGAVLAAVGVGMAPEEYAKTDKAKAGLAKLRDYFAKTAPPSLHHRAWLMWASLKLDGLMSKLDREKTIKELLALQRSDGGWSLPSLGDWKGVDGRKNDKNAPSDGYGTGLVVFVLRQAGLGADHVALKKGAEWLKSNQRVSGRWFTRSLNTNDHHFITHTGTAFAILALKACEATPPPNPLPQAEGGWKTAESR
jgi:squalene-hopene/tetraprenyl-beta-curcumene cyclase